METHNNGKRWLSKTQINCFRQCPYKWKLIYIDRIQVNKSDAQQRGVDIHKELESFYKNVKIIPIGEKITSPVIIPKVNMERINNFVEFEKKRIETCIKDGRYMEKYFKPLFQELYVENKELMLRGFIDAVYINPSDDEIIIIDWKTGKYNEKYVGDYRFELAMYKELLEKSVDLKGKKVKYWGIYFIDADKLFFEEVKTKYVKSMYKKIENVRKKLEEKNYKAKPGILCRWCDFNGVCKEWQNVV